MSTLADLINSIHSSLHSYTGVQEQVTWLTSAIDADDTTVPVASLEAVLRGIAEIDNELIYVNTSSDSGLELAPFGRGYRGSTAATHAQNAEVTFDPVFPKVEIRRAIEQVVAGLYPLLYRVRTTDLTYTPTPIGYNLPVDCEKVLQVKYEANSDSLNYWAPVYNWTFDDSSPESTGKVLNLMDYLRPGGTIRVVYQARFGTFASDASALSTVGLEESYADVILYGVVARMIRFLDSSRLQTQTVENLGRAQVVQAGDAGRIANQLYAMYQQRLTEERKNLLERVKPGINFTSR